MPIAPDCDEIAEPDWNALFANDPQLAHRAAEVWRLTVAAMGAVGTLAPINGLQIGRYSMMCALYDQAAARAASEDIVREDAYKGSAAWSPWWSALRYCDELCSAHEDRLGLSPRGRDKAAIVKKKAKIAPAAIAYLVPRT